MALGAPFRNPPSLHLGGLQGPPSPPKATTSAGEMVPFVDRTFEWGVVIATFLSVLSVVPCHCACLTYFLHPKLREINAVPSTLQLITGTLRTCGAQ